MDVLDRAPLYDTSVVSQVAVVLSDVVKASDLQELSPWTQRTASNLLIRLADAASAPLHVGQHKLPPLQKLDIYRWALASHWWRFDQRRLPTN